MAEQEQSKWQFEEEIKALGAEEVQAEFSGYFASIVRDITLHTLVSASHNPKSGDRAWVRQCALQRGCSAAGRSAGAGEGDAEREEKGIRIHRGL